MRYQPLLAISALLGLAACGSGTDEATASDSRNEAASIAGGGGSDALIISPRTYTSGTVKAKVTGFFEVDGSQDLNKPASITDEDQTWIQYGVSGAQELHVLFTNSAAMAEHGVTIGVGPYSVTTTSTSGECRTKIDVQPATITGHYSCKGSMGYNSKTGEMGKVDVEVDFAASS